VDLRHLGARPITVFRSVGPQVEPLPAAASTAPM
jgi:hypothetical protein